MKKVIILLSLILLITFTFNCFSYADNLTEVVKIPSESVNLSNLGKVIQDDISEYVPQNINVAAGGYDFKTASSLSSYDSRSYRFEYPASSGDRFSLSFQGGGTGFCVLFVNNLGIKIGSAGNELPWSTHYDYTFTAPQGTTNIRVSIWLSTIPNNAILKKLTYNGIVNKAKFDLVKEDILNLQSIYIDKKNVYNWLAGDIYNGSVVTGGTNNKRLTHSNIGYTKYGCKINYDWSTYRIYLWNYSDKNGLNPVGVGWKTEPFTINEGTYFRLLLAKKVSEVAINDGGTAMLSPLVFSEMTDTYNRITNLETSISILNSNLSNTDNKSICISPNVKGINHRGYNTVSPENTLPAYRLSKKNGFSYVETDVRFTSDGIPVLLHDETINRTARNVNGSEISSNINIADITYAQSQTYDFGIWKDAAYKGTRIPKFEDFIKLCRNLGLHPYIELKTGTGISTLVNIVKSYGMAGKVTWIGGYETLLSIKSLYSKARLGIVVYPTVTSKDIANAVSLKNDFNDVFINSWGDTVTSDIVNACIQNDIPLEVYNYNSPAGITGLNPYISGVQSNSLNAEKILLDANIN